jgi:hypothetical protein
MFFEFSAPDVFDAYIIGGGCKLVVPVEPFRLHQRMTAQQGLFLCQGDLATPVMDNLASMHDGKPRALPPVRRSSYRALSKSKRCRI